MSDSLWPHGLYIACLAPLSMEFSRQKYWSGLPFPSQGIFLIHGLNLGLLNCRQILYPLRHQGSGWCLSFQQNYCCSYCCLQPVSMLHLLWPRKGQDARGKWKGWRNVRRENKQVPILGKDLQERLSWWEHDLLITHTVDLGFYQVINLKGRTWRMYHLRLVVDPPAVAPSPWATLVSAFIPLANATCSLCTH